MDTNVGTAHPDKKITAKIAKNLAVVLINI